MKLAIVHYHLNRGGVTRVIENQLRALDGVLQLEPDLEVALIAGGRREGFNERLPEHLQSIRLREVSLSRLDYDEVHGQESRSGQLTHDLTAALHQLGFEPGDTVVHVHNHSMAKNLALAPALRALAERGYALLVQIHDFAEDFRPASFARFLEGAGDDPVWHGWLYPQAAHVHYALLNSRDYAILEAAGVEPTRLWLLPNPVPDLGEMPARDEARAKLAERFGVAGDRRLLLYPVRCIRRKNVGEALLWAALAPDATLALTLAPINPAEQPIYQAWKEAASAWDLPCLFEVGAPGALSFLETLSASDAVLTTSVAEGFGMVFLEAWLAGRPLVGRDLPEVTDDYRRAGLNLDWLEPRLNVPVDWVGRHALRQRLLDAYRVTLARYGRPQPVDLTAPLEAKFQGDLVDFADLDEPFQEQVLQRVHHSESDRKELLDLNPSIESNLFRGEEERAETIRQNVEIISRQFSLVPSGERLAEIYHRLIECPRDQVVGPLAQPQRILERLLDLGRFRLIRS